MKTKVLATLDRAAAYHRDEAKLFAGGRAGSMREVVANNAVAQADDIVRAYAAITELCDAGDFLAQVGPTDGALRRWARAKEAL